MTQIFVTNATPVEYVARLDVRKVRCGDKGAVVITCGPDEFRIGVSGLTDRELQDALCVAIHYNFCHMEEASAS